MLNQLQQGDEPALLPCRRSGFLRRPRLSRRECNGEKGLVTPIKPYSIVINNNGGTHVIITQGPLANDLLSRMDRYWRATIYQCE
jgi:hypothetical protein